jgi:CRP-like cAMP-binding protein
MASVKALEKTHLLRLDQDSFYDLMANHSDVVQGVIRVLLRHLRSTVRGSK